MKILAVSLYRFAFRYSSWVFFQNEEDRKDFLGVVKINPAKTGLLPGSGVDTDYFKPSRNDIRQKRETVFLMISRLIVEKGVSDYVEAIKLLKPGNPDCKFILVGGLDESHSRSISRLMLDEWIAEGWIEYHDHAADIRPFIERADVVVLPSYREGTPKTLLEAGAMGKALIATDVPGCRQVVLDGENGFLCKLKNPVDLASKMKLYMALSAEERTIMGKNARESIINRYDQRIVIEHYARKIDDLVKQI